MSHPAVPAAGPELVAGSEHHFGRFTQAKTGKEPTLKLIQHGHMPKTKKRHGARKRIG
jgi:hypothetical protein